MPRQRRRFTAEQKLRAVEEADACKLGELGAVLRKYGIYASHLVAWRKQREEARACGETVVDLRWRPIDIPLATACRAVSMSRATLYRTRRPRPMRVPHPRPLGLRRLSDEERAAVVDTLTSDAFCDQPPAEV